MQAALSERQLELNEHQSMLEEAEAALAEQRRAVADREDAVAEREGEWWQQWPACDSAASKMLQSTFFGKHCIILLVLQASGQLLMGKGLYNKPFVYIVCMEY
jgi:hypothetical protein